MQLARKIQEQKSFSARLAADSLALTFQPLTASSALLNKLRCGEWLTFYRGRKQTLARVRLCPVTRRPTEPAKPARFQQQQALLPTFEPGSAGASNLLELQKSAVASEMTAFKFAACCAANDAASWAEWVPTGAVPWSSANDITWAESETGKGGCVLRSTECRLLRSKVLTGFCWWEVQAAAGFGLCACQNRQDLEVVWGSSRFQIRDTRRGQMRRQAQVCSAATFLVDWGKIPRPRLSPLVRLDEDIDFGRFSPPTCLMSLHHADF